MRDRIEALKKTLKTQRLDGLLISKRENIRYLTGHEIDDSMLVVTPRDRDYLITDSRFKELAEERLPDFNLELLRGLRHNSIARVIKDAKIERLGFESRSLSYTDFADLKKRLKDVELVPKTCVVEDLRIIKDSYELALIKRAAKIARDAIYYAKKIIRPGQTGRQVAILIDNFMRLHGSDRPAFETIAAQEPYSSYPHAQATEKRFARDSVILIDMGAVYKGYNSDLTRIFFLGRITGKIKRIYNIIKAAQKKAIERVRPGLSISQIDMAARRYISDKGVGRYFIHSLGHGVGLEVHESPKISGKVKKVLKPGMVFTIEPGVYIPGWGGIRIEDMVVVTDKGCEVITDDIAK